MIVSVALLLLSFFATDRILSIILEELVLTSNFRYSQLYAGQADAEVLVLGNSRGVNAIYAPEFERLTGLKTLNLSYNGLSSRIGLCILADYLKFNKRPNRVILEITNIGDPNTLIRDLKLYTGKSNRLNRLLEQESPTIAWIDHFIRLYKFNGQMFLRALYYLDKSDQTWINRYTIDPNYARLHLNDRAISNEQPYLNPDNLLALKDTILLLDENGIDYSLIVTPSLGGLMHQDGMTTWKRTVMEHLPGNVEILDFSSSIEDLGAFADSIHMNDTGSRIFLPELIEALHL